MTTMIDQSAVQLLEEGMAFLKAGQPQEAIGAWSRALDIQPDYPQAQTNRGTARASLGDLPGGLEDLNAVIAARPDYADAYLNRANVYLKMGQLEKALEDLNAVVTLQPNAFDAYYNRANTYADLHRNNPRFYGPSERITPNYRIALADYNRAIELNPELAEAYSNRAGLNFEVLTRMPPPNPNLPQMMQIKEHSQEARQALAASIEQDLNTALKLRPDRANDYKHRGVFHLMLTGRLENALSDLTRALELNPQLLDALIFRCQVHNRMRHFEMAVADATRVIELRPHDPNLYFNRGINRRLAGDHKGAVADFTHTLELDPNQIKAYPNRAESLSELGEKKSAIADWEKYLELGGGKRFGDEKAVLEKIKKLKSFSFFGR